MVTMMKLVTVCLALQGAAAFVQQQQSLTRPSLALNSFFTDIMGTSSSNTKSRPRTEQYVPRQRASRSRGGSLARPRNDSRNGIQRRSSNRKNSWGRFNPTIVQGGSLETWSFPSVDIDKVKVRLVTQGRPMNANVELWQGPDNSPQKMAVYIEDGNYRPFSALVATPRGSNAIAVRNTANLEFPLAACVEPENGDAGLWDIFDGPDDYRLARTVQGGSVHTIPFAPEVESVQLLLKTDGRPLNARVELLQGPNNNKQVIDIHTEDGMERPFLAVIETPGVGNVIRMINMATMEFPMTAYVEPFEVQPGYIYDASYMQRGTGGGYGSSNIQGGWYK